MSSISDDQEEQNNRIFEAEEEMRALKMENFVSVRGRDARVYRHFNFSRSSFIAQSLNFSIQICLTSFTYLINRNDWQQWFHRSGEVREKISLMEVIVIDLLVILEWSMMFLVPVLWFLLYKLWRSRARQLAINYSLEYVVAKLENLYVISMTIVFCGFYFMDVLSGGDDCRTQNVFEACEDEYTQRGEYLVVFVPLLHTTIFRNTSSSTKCIVLCIMLVAMITRAANKTGAIFDLLFMVFPIAAVIIYDMDRMRFESFLLTRGLDALHKRERKFLETAHQQQMKSVVANIAHDLRTPLTSIGLGSEFVYSILRGLDADIDKCVNMGREEKYEVRDQLRQSMKGVLNMTNSISVINIAVNQSIDFAKSQYGRLVLIPSSRPTIVKGVIEFAVNVSMDSISPSSLTFGGSKVTPSERSSNYSHPRSARKERITWFIEENIERSIISDPIWLRESLYSLLLLVAENIDPVDSESNVEVHVRLLSYKDLKRARRCTVFRCADNTPTDIPVESSISDSISDSISNNSPLLKKRVNTPQKTDLHNKKRYFPVELPPGSLATSGEEEEREKEEEGLDENVVFIIFEVRRCGNIKQWRDLSSAVSNAKSITTHFKGGTSMGIYSLAERIESLNGTYGVQYICPKSDDNAEPPPAAAAAAMGGHVVGPAALAAFTPEQQPHRQRMDDDNKCCAAAYFAIPYVPHDPLTKTNFPTYYGGLSSNKRRSQECSSVKSSQSSTVNSQPSTPTSALQALRNYLSFSSRSSSTASSPRALFDSAVGGGRKLDNDGVPSSFSRSRSSPGIGQKEEDSERSDVEGIELSIKSSSSSQSQSSPNRSPKSPSQLVPAALSEAVVAAAAAVEEKSKKETSTQEVTTRPNIPPPIQICEQNSQFNNSFYRRLDPAVAGAESPHFRNKMNVLVVEDTMSVRKMVVMLLKRDGHTVDTAENGQIGVDKWMDSLKAKRYDLILMDIQMPVMDGLDAIRAIRRVEESMFYMQQQSSIAQTTRELNITTNTSYTIGTTTNTINITTGSASQHYQHIIAMSANDATEYRNRALAAGSDSYMTKPFNMKTLYEVIKEYV